MGKSGYRTTQIKADDHERISQIKEQTGYPMWLIVRMALNALEKTTRKRLK